MAKDALGRGLGNLMGGEKPVSERSTTNGNASKVSPGMATLLQGQKEDRKDEEEKRAEVEAAPKGEASSRGQEPGPLAGYRGIVRVSLFVADGLLVALAARVAFKSGGSFGFSEAALCAGALAMGAWLTCLAIQMKR